MATYFKRTKTQQRAYAPHTAIRPLNARPVVMGQITCTRDGGMHRATIHPDYQSHIFPIGVG